jgi:hypothetical protein
LPLQDQRSSSERFLILAVIANHLLLISALWEAADSAGEYHSNDAGNASELLGLEKVTLGAARAVEFVVVAFVDDNGGALRSGWLLHHHWIHHHWLGLHHHHWLLDHHGLHVHL